MKYRTRNSVAAVSADDGLCGVVLFYLRILAPPSIRFQFVSCAATGLGSKMVAGRSIFVR